MHPPAATAKLNICLVLLGVPAAKVLSQPLRHGSCLP